MNTIQLIFKKDVLRLRWLLVCWVGIIALRCVISSSFFLDNIETQTRMLQSSQWIFSLMVFMLFVLIPLLVHDDSLIGSTAFWMGKPLSRKALLISKTIFILSFFIVLPTTAELLTLAENGITAHYLWLAVPQILSTWGGIALPVFLLASMTQRFNHFAIVLLSIGVVLIIINNILNLPVNSLLSGNYIPDYHNFHYTLGSLEISKLIITNIITIFGSILLITHQYLTGKTRRTILLSILILLIVPVANWHWSWDYLKSYTAYDKDWSHEKNIRYQLHLHKTDPQPQTKIAESTAQSNPFTITIDYYLDIDPAQFLAAKFSEDYQYNRLTKFWNHASSLSSLSLGNNYVETEPYIISLINLFEGYDLIPSVKNTSNSRPNYQHLIDEFTENHTHSLTDWQFKNKMFWQIYRFRITSTIPFKKNAKNTLFAQQYIVKDIKKAPQKAIATILEKDSVLTYDLSATKKIYYHTDYYSKKSEWKEGIYILRNNKTQEIVFPSFDNDPNNKRFNDPGQILQGNIRHIHFLGNDNTPLDEQWLADAELLRVDAIPEGHYQYKLAFDAATAEFIEKNEK
ncbi:MAG: hypothetical protein H6753_01515 [Candidatus Omnitrophica bacterium]|nr:hypothetical protein [Candidatus Omnitrophota bacterium]